jgi:hypothetical protein
MQLVSKSIIPKCQESLKNSYPISFGYINAKAGFIYRILTQSVKLVTNKGGCVISLKPYATTFDY